eukprot:CAMPEP_0201991214 /NCGR_PEP_ID=MMETSP0905-20130828/57_1 /ASSEMBLY_ACC=CAM_ASM_000554 /TAXON_ID=420261 /ORGANISM="Thalassiosira antarctica, Strain CCMP982" /LENGTH=88 /DNA_ID=CAMNT_0048545545 /DNA_START=293 /DNA_END=556 /DNA_ORIENTATION=-
MPHLTTRLTGGAITVSGNIGGGPLLLDIIELFVELDGLSLVQGLESLLVDGGEVDEDILASVLGGDETESLVGEELDRAVGCHLDEFI